MLSARPLKGAVDELKGLRRLRRVLLGRSLIREEAEEEDTPRCGWIVGDRPSSAEDDEAYMLAEAAEAADGDREEAGPAMVEVSSAARKWTQ